jgi:cell division protease FtsH
VVIFKVLNQIRYILGADISNVVNEAAILAATKKQRSVTVQDLSNAMEKVIAGPEKRSRVLVQEEKEIVAYHERLVFLLSDKL